MSAKRCFLFVCFLLSGLSLKAEEPQISGGIVYSDGKDAVYYDFAKKQRTNLTADVKDVVVSGPFAVSEDGRMLVWKQGNLFLAKEFPSGKASPIKTKKYGEERVPPKTGSAKNAIRIYDFSCPPDTNGLVVSSDGEKIAYMLKSRSLAWVKTGASKRDQTGGPTGWADIPYYIKKPDVFFGINVLETKRVNERPAETLSYIFNGNRVPVDENDNDIIALFGNAASHSPFPLPVRLPEPPGATHAYLGGYKRLQSICNGISLNLQDALARFSVKRNAFFPAFAKMSSDYGQHPSASADSYKPDGLSSPEMLCLLYQSQAGCVIYIQKFGKALQSASKKDPCFYEIPVNVRTCQGLAWKPDGSITYLSEGNFYSLDGQKIREGMAASTAVLDNSVGIENTRLDRMYPHQTSRGTSHLPQLVAANNLFRIQPGLVAKGIMGSGLCWVSDTAFVFRGADKCLYYWENNKSEKKSGPISECFCWCRYAPGSRPVQLADYGEGKAWEQSIRPEKDVSSFVVGRISLEWRQSKLARNKINEDRVGIGPKTGDADSLRLEYAQLTNNQQKEIEEVAQISDPTQYRYRMFFVSESSIGVERTFSLGEIFLLKLDDSYAAIKPIAVESVKQAKTKTQKKDSERKQLIYEWKYWPNGSKQPVALNK